MRTFKGTALLTCILGLVLGAPVEVHDTNNELLQPALGG